MEEIKSWNDMKVSQLCQNFFEAFSAMVLELFVAELKFLN